MPEARHFVALNEVNTLRVAPAGAGPVELLLVDDVFAPGHESLTIAYSVHTAVARARLEVRCPLHGAEPLFVAPLQPDDLHPGSRYTFAWDGITTCSAGELAGNYVNPLYAPYDVVIVYDDGTGEAETPARSFVVRYHSLKIDIGPWTADHQPPPAAQRDKWLRYHLNKAGYWAGPVEEDLDDGLSKAIKRYKRHHPGHVQRFPDHYDDVCSDDLAADLQRGRFAREIVRPETGNAFGDPSAEMRILVEEAFAEGNDLEDFRFTHEARELVQPVLPIEVKPLLVTKSGGPAHCPLATGSVRIDLRIDEVPEDLSRQALFTGETPSRARIYLERVKKEFATAARSNCPDNHGGISAADGSWQTAIVLGAGYPPFLVHADTDRGVVFTHAAPPDTPKPPVAGSAVFLFRPSWIGGDGYRLGARVDFRERANAKQLEAINGEIASSTGTLRIWREVPLAAFVKWPGRDPRSRDIPRIRAELARAYVDLGGAGREIDVNDILDTEAYRDALRDGHRTPNPDTFALDGAALYGGPIPPQGTTIGPEYETKIYELMKSFVSNFDILSHSWTQLGWYIRRAVQPTHGYGLSIVEFELHRPIDILSDPGSGPELYLTGVVNAFISWAGESGVVFMDCNLVPAKAPGDGLVEDLSLHELGHVLYLRHVDPGADPNKSQHDPDDYACIMKELAEKTRAFCGKCVLNLRGWKLNGLPGRSGDG